jgi:hypothetical protein
MSSVSSTRKRMGVKGRVKYTKDPSFRIHLQYPKLPVCGRVQFGTIEQLQWFSESLRRALDISDPLIRRLLLADLMKALFANCKIHPPNTPPSSPLVGVELNPGPPAPSIFKNPILDSLQSSADATFDTTMRFVHSACIRAGLCESDAINVEREYLKNRSRKFLADKNPDETVRRSKIAARRLRGPRVSTFLSLPPPAPPLVGIEENPGPYDKKNAVKTHRTAPTKAKKPLRKGVVSIPNTLSLRSGDAPANRSFKTTMRSAQYYHAEGGGLGLVRREFVTDVVSSASAYVFLSTPLQGLNPGNPSLFPWVSTIATNFGEYRFKKISFSFCSELSTGSSGSFSIGATSDPTDPQPASKTAIYQYKNSTRCNVWESCTFDVPPLMLQRLNRFIVSTKSSGYTEQDMLKQCGAVFWATDGVGASIACGEVWVTYALGLYNEQPSSSVSGLISGTPNVSGSIANSNFVSGSYANLGLLPVVNSSVFPLPSGYSAYGPNTFIVQKGGSYMFTTIWTGTGITTGDTWVSIDKDGDTNATYTNITSVINVAATTLTTIFRFDSLNTTILEPYVQLGNPIYVVLASGPQCTTMTNLKVYVTPMGVAGSGDIGLMNGRLLGIKDQKSIYSDVILGGSMNESNTEASTKITIIKEGNDNLLSSPGPKASSKGRYVFVEEPGD